MLTSTPKKKLLSVSLWTNTASLRKHYQRLFLGDNGLLAKVRNEDNSTKSECPKIAPLSHKTDYERRATLKTHALPKLFPQIQAVVSER